jgi:hypothetical protein
MDLQNDNWTRGLWKMTSAGEMAELIKLWSLIQEVQLSQEEDQLIWRWSADGVYSAKSAYEVQFRGTYSTLNCSALWKAKAEGKHRFFAWLLLQSKILTADKLLLWNWPCNPTCMLCDQHAETAEHLTLHCVFSQEVWALVNAWTGGLVPVPQPDLSLESWWNSTLRSATKNDKRRLATLLIYAAWNLWKERNRRIFDHRSASPSAVLTLIKEEISLRRLACGDGVLPLEEL